MTFAAKLEDALQRLIDRSREIGVRPETTVYYATGDTRALASLRRKAVSIDEKIDRINRYLDKPPQK